MWKYLIDNPEWKKKFIDVLNIIETIQERLDSFKSPRMPFTETLQSLKILELEIVDVFEKGFQGIPEFTLRSRRESASVYRLKTMVKDSSASFDRESKQWIEANPSFSATLLLIRMDIEKLKLFVNDIRELDESVEDPKVLYRGYR